MPCCRQKVAVNVKAELVPCQVKSSLKGMVNFAFQYPWEEPELCLLWVEHKSTDSRPKGVGFLFLYKTCHICRECFSPVTLPRRNQDPTGCLMPETRRGKKTALIPVRGVVCTESSKFATPKSALILGYSTGTKAAALSCLTASWGDIMGP